MGVGGVETAVVYLPAQAINPLSASKEPIALALTPRPNPTEVAEAEAAKASDKVAKAISAVDPTGLGNGHEKHRTVSQSDQSTFGAASIGRVDVYV